MDGLLRNLFEQLNNCCNYLILRNWDNVFEDVIYGEGHEDIDVLCDNLDEFLKISKAKRIHSNKHRDNYIVELENRKVRFDIRWVGDGYYPEKWERTMLDRRLFSNPGVYVMCPEDYCFSLAYHALIQKSNLSEEYKNKIVISYKGLMGNDLVKSKRDLLKILDEYLKEKSYKVVLPEDPGVYFNWEISNILPHHYSNILKLRRIIFQLRNRLSNR